MASRRAFQRCMQRPRRSWAGEDCIICLQQFGLVYNHFTTSIPELISDEFYEHYDRTVTYCLEALKGLCFLWNEENFDIKTAAVEEL